MLTDTPDMPDTTDTVHPGHAAPAGTTASTPFAAADADSSDHDTSLAIERASLHAWPALTDSDFDGWRLRFANGYTRRANSITPLYPSRLPLQDKVATCERLYSERGLPTIFRLTPFAPPELDGFLASRGYLRGDEVEVRARALSTTTPLPARRVSAAVRAYGLNRWLAIFESMSGASAANHRAHRAVLTLVPGVRRLLALSTKEGVVACGMSVLVDGRLGLFDLVTAAQQRRRGYGSDLLRRGLLWGQRAGASQAYLQVLERNGGAKRIYDRAGFQIVYRYHYREKH